MNPLSWLYGLAVARRNRRFDAGVGVQQAPLPVVSVGNLSTGGTGKTPVVRWLAEQLRERGRQVAIVSRGYGGKAGVGPVVVSRGEGPLESAELVGDEPWMLAALLPGVCVVVGSDRVRGAKQAQQLGADLVLLDDGFQHRFLARQFDLVLADASRPFWDAALLPIGRLREPVDSLHRADALMITRDRSQATRERFRSELAQRQIALEVYSSDHQSAGLFDSQGNEVSVPPRAIAFCGIGHPQRFRQDLERLGIELVDFIARRDHQRIREDEFRGWVRRAATEEAALITTDKDRARLGALADGSPLRTLRITTAIDRGDELLERILAAITPR